MSWEQLPARTALRSLASLARHEFLMTLRERSGWGSMVAACALAFADSALHPLTPLVSGVRASALGGSLVLPFMAILLAAGAARRDQTTSAADVVRARPYRAHLLLLARVLSNFAVIALAYVLVIACALAAPLAFAGRLPSPLLLLHAFSREVLALFFVVTLAYCAVALAQNPLAAAVVAVYAAFVFLWGDYLALIFNFTLTQNRLTYLLLALGMLVATMAWAQWAEGIGDLRRTRRLLLAPGIALALLGVGNAWRQVATTHEKPLHQDAFALNMASQDVRACPRAPGFWLPDQHGRDFRVSSLDGRVLVLAFWSPHVPESIPTLDTLQATARAFPGGNVVCCAVCLADDHRISADVACEGHYTYPVVTDTGTHFSRSLSKCSPMAEAYDLAALPTIIVTDSGRRIVAQLTLPTGMTAEGIIAAAQQALAIPQPPS